MLFSFSELPYFCAKKEQLWSQGERYLHFYPVLCADNAPCEIRTFNLSISVSSSPLASGCAPSALPKKSGSFLDAISNTTHIAGLGKVSPPCIWTGDGQSSIKPFKILKQAFPQKIDFLEKWERTAKHTLDILCSQRSLGSFFRERFCINLTFTFSNLTELWFVISPANQNTLSYPARRHRTNPTYNICSLVRQEYVLPFL